MAFKKFTASEKILKPDPRYNSKLLSKFINCMMWDGKKTVAQNLELIRRLDEIVAIGRPVAIGTSRKSFLGRLTGRSEAERVAGTVATNVLAYERGARIFRVHDVAPAVDALRVAGATVTGEWTIPTS